MSVFGAILVHQLDWIRRIRSIYPYSVWILENADQDNFKYGHFSHNETIFEKSFILIVSIGSFTSLSSVPNSWTTHFQETLRSIYFYSFILLFKKPGIKIDE